MKKSDKIRSISLIKIQSKRAQFNFVWIFALLVGGAILALAIFGATKTGNTLRYQSDTQIAKSISIITDPMQVGFGSGSFSRINFKQQTRINNICFSGQFGKNEISVATESDVGKKWNMAGGATSIHNKYIFSSEKNSGKEYYVFSKPFNFPYKIADLLFLTSRNYCFVGAPRKVADEIEGLNIPNIKIGNCTTGDAIKVCFSGGASCDIKVYGSCLSGCNSVYDSGTVLKGSDKMNYVGNLMFAAIFSDKQIYDCNVKRLMFRNSQIAKELANKADLMNGRGCNTNMKSDLLYWEGLTLDAGSRDLIRLKTISDNLELKKNRELCGVWQ